MPIDVTCPECDKAMRVREETVGKKITCPKCGHRFVAKSSTDAETIGMEEDERPTRKKKRPKRRRDDDDDDDDRPRKKKRSAGGVKQVPTPMAPVVWGVLAILMPCPLVGLAIAGIAINRAMVELGSLPSGRSGNSARRNMKIVIGLGIAACVISLVLSLWILVVGRR